LPHAADAPTEQHALHATYYSDSQIATHCRRVNFENSNFNVGLPVFTIHGNHDDPAGADNLSAVDVLSTCNLVNYFGKAVSVFTLLWHPLDQLLCPSMPIAAVQCSSRLQWYMMADSENPFGQCESITLLAHESPVVINTIRMCACENALGSAGALWVWRGQDQD